MNFKLLITSLFLFAVVATNAQTWNGIGVKKMTFRYGPVVIGTDEIPASADVANQDLSNYKLFVCGGILADEWLVPNTTWCDYVFEPDYQLLSLEAVAQHIEETGHLHNTPSAEEIEAEGLNMKAATLNQQEKIEEIYLHLIQLNERVKNLEAENETLKAANAKLTQTVETLTQNEGL